MTLDEACKLVSAESQYPLVGSAESPDSFLMVLARGPAQYTFALSKFALEQANFPSALIAAHVKIANADLDMLKDGGASLPAWG